MEKKITNQTYHERMNLVYSLKLREMLKELPSFCSGFFRGIESNTSARTRLAYATDIKTFFKFIIDNNPEYKTKTMHSIEMSVLDKVTSTDIEEYLEYLKYYSANGKTQINNERAKKRKLSSLRSFYAYFIKKEFIKYNPVILVDMPKLHDKEIIRLDDSEVERLLDTVENGNNLTKKQSQFHEKTKVRDLAILSLLLGTGIRVSECVGLNINDVDYKNSGIKITRKGGNEVVVYFSDEVKDSLLNYHEQRINTIAKENHEEAYFLSLQKSRLTVRSVEKLVKKYSSIVTTMKKITPHKLRSTYGTALYKETGDIYLVADVLGHKDVNTTKKHYAAIEDERRKGARNIVKLRKENINFEIDN